MAKNDDKGYVTKADLEEVVDAIMKGMSNMFENLHGEIKSMKDDIDSRFNTVHDQLGSIRVELSALKDEVSGLGAELSNTPTRKEFEDLKDRVDKYHPIS